MEAEAEACLETGLEAGLGGFKAGQGGMVGIGLSLKPINYYTCFRIFIMLLKIISKITLIKCHLRTNGMLLKNRPGATVRPFDSVANSVL